MNLLVLNLCLALVWVLLTGTLTLLNLIIGFGIGYFVLLMLRNVFPRARYFRTVPYLIEFLLYFAWELLLANLRVAIDVLTPRHRMHPRVLALLDVKTDEGSPCLQILLPLPRRRQPGCLFRSDGDVSACDVRVRPGTRAQDHKGRAGAAGHPALRGIERR